MTVKAINEIIGQYQISKGITKKEIIELNENRNISSIQFSSPLNEIEFDYLEEYLFSKRTDITLRVYGHYSEKCDLNFLKRIPSLQNFSADCLRSVQGFENVLELRKIETLGIGIFDLENFDVLENINPNLKKLYLHQTKSKKPKIDSIKRFHNLECLYLESQSKGIEEIKTLKNLKDLTLRSITTENLDYLIGLNELWSVDVKLGRIKNFKALESLQNLKYLELWQIRELSDLSFISNLKNLQNLFIQSLPNVTELPNLENLVNLRRIYLENLKGLKNLDSLKNAKALKDFIYVSAINLEIENLIPAIENQNLENIRCGFGSSKKNIAFEKLVLESGKKTYNYSKFEYK
jgi:hypothetical protein